MTADISNPFTFIGTTSVSPTDPPCAWRITTSFSLLVGGICDDDHGDVFCGDDGTDDNSDGDDNNNECDGGWPV